MNPSVAKKASLWAGPIILAFSCAANANGIGFFGEVSALKGGTDYRNYRGTVSSSVFDERAPFVPPKMRFTMRSTTCGEGKAGFRWIGGDTSAGGVSYTSSLFASVAGCDSRMFADLRFVKAYILARIDDAVRNAIDTEINDAVPSDLRDIANDLGINPDPYLALASDTIADYVLDLSQPIPDDSDIVAAFERLPVTSDPDVEDLRMSLLDEVLNAAEEARNIREAIGDVKSLPDAPDRSGFMASVGFGGSFEIRRHLSSRFLFNASPASNAFWFVNLEAQASANISSVDNPLRSVIKENRLLVPFVGIEAQAGVGLAFENVAASGWNVRFGGNQPFSQYKVLGIDGISLEKDDDFYWAASFSNTRVMIGDVLLPDVEFEARHTPETGMTRFNIGLQWD